MRTKTSRNDRPMRKKSTAMQISSSEALRFPVPLEDQLHNFRRLWIEVDGSLSAGQLSMRYQRQDKCYHLDIKKVSLAMSTFLMPLWLRNFSRQQV